MKKDNEKVVEMVKPEAAKEELVVEPKFYLGKSTHTIYTQEEYALFTINEAIRQFKASKKLQNEYGYIQEFIIHVLEQPDPHFAECDKNGKVIAEGKAYEEDLLLVDTESDHEDIIKIDEIEEIREALKLGISDYFYKC